MREGLTGCGRALVVASGIFLASAVAAPSALAQTPEEKAGARAAATEGAKAFQAGDFQKAVDMFKRAESLVHAPPHLLYMARAHAKLGQFVRAKELYNEIIREQLAPGAPGAFAKAQESARAEIGGVEGKIAKLTIEVKGLEAGVAPVVTIDGKEVPAALVGVPYPVDPGEHEVVATAEGYTSATKEISLEEAGSGAVVLEIAVDPNAKPAAPPTEPAPGGAGEPKPAGGPGPVGDGAVGVDSGGGSGLAIPAYIALGVGALGVGAGVLFTLQSAGARSDADDLFDQCAGNGVGGQCRSDDPLSGEIAQKDDDAGSAQTLAIVGYSVGAVGLAVGVTLLVMDLTSGSSTATLSERKATTAGVSPWMDVTGDGTRFGLRGRF